MNSNLLYIVFTFFDANGHWHYTAGMYNYHDYLVKA